MDGMLSPADIALLTNRSGDSGFGDGNGAWWIILFLIFGFGRNGNGFGNGGGAVDGYTLTSDFANIERKLDGVNNGICDSTFALNNTATQGFAGINTALVQNGYEVHNAIQGVSSQLAGCCCDLKQQIADCCCTTQRGIDSINFNAAQNTCAITNTINTGIRDIIENQNNNYRAIHEELIANKLEMKNDRIAELQSQVNKLQLSASQQAQNAYLLGELKANPVPAYVVPNPNCCYNPCSCTGTTVI